MNAKCIKLDADAEKETAELAAKAKLDAAKEQLDACANDRMKNWCKENQSLVGCFSTGEFSTLPKENETAWAGFRAQCAKELLQH